MSFIKRTSIDNYVLKVDKIYDPAKLNLDVWDDYLNCLCVGRQYQKEAIKTAVTYLVSGKYRNISQLAQENYNTSEVLQDKYGNVSKLIKLLQMPNMLSATIDLATGTGKSYVIFAIANILMCIGYCERVLILCPSTTIEAELIKKFNELLYREDLKHLIPNTCKITDFRLVDANQTIENGDICIENIHAVYANTGSSIKDSFLHSGSNTLVLSDEVHHCYNVVGNSAESKSLKKWKEFIMDEQFAFKAHIGFTGTAYINDDYFTDVIYRYSLRQAIIDKIVKKVKYVDEDITDNDDEKFQKIYINHEKIKQEIALSNLKPLSIIITADIKKANGLREDFLDFLEKFTQHDRNYFEDKVIVVTSAVEHKTNLLKLKEVDNYSSPVEWIISVSMLTEGWDVKNVFQIVPWEDRAFNSKLLIAQVLGRGLRVPPVFSTIQPEVRVMNHASWSKNIRKIVDEILEQENTLTSRIVDPDDSRSKYNFDVHNLNYEQVERESFNDDYEKSENFDMSKPLTLITQSTTITRNTVFLSTDETAEKRIYEIQRETKSVDEVVCNIVRRFQSRNNEAKKRNLLGELVFEDGQSELDKLPSPKEIKEWILLQMAAANIKGDRLTVENIKKINGRFTGMLRKKRTTAGFYRKAKDIQVINTSKMSKSESRFSALNNGGTIFYPSDMETSFADDERDILNEFLDALPRANGKEKNVYLFKTPLNFVVVNREPEKRFVDEVLFDVDLSKKITAWVKSRDTGFYSIQYILQRGTEPQSFNPDFFIKIGDNIAVIETKADNDICKENFSKMVDTRKHFETLNKQFEEEGSSIRYRFNMLSPCSYSDFKKVILEETYFTDGFISKLEADLEEKIKNKE